MKHLGKLLLTFLVVVIVGCSTHPTPGDWYERKEDRRRFKVIAVEDQWVIITNESLRKDMSTPNTSLRVDLDEFATDYTLVK